MATVSLNPGEEAQLQQTIEMFEVIVQSQPNDCQSLEILKEAYSKLGREADVINTSKRIAQAYVQTGQLSSAILEFETVLQRQPDDEEVQAALKEIEGKANHSGMEAAEPAALTMNPDTAALTMKKALGAEEEIDEGRNGLHKFFVESKVITAGDFEMCWQATDMTTTPTDVIEPFIQKLQDKGLLPLEKALKLMSDKARMAYLPLEKYDVDIDLTRGFPAEVCRRWCVLPFDRMSKAILVATANPFNQQAVKELSEATSHRLVWYLAPPTDILINLRKAFR